MPFGCIGDPIKLSTSSRVECSGLIQRHPCALEEAAKQKIRPAKVRSGFSFFIFHLTDPSNYNYRKLPYGSLILAWPNSASLRLEYVRGVLFLASRVPR